MGLDVCALVRRDHEDLDRALAAMVDPGLAPNELSYILDALRLALAVHSATEAKVFGTLLASVRAPSTLTMLAAQARAEHLAQRTAADDLTFVRPGSIAWYERALELRVSMLDHSGRAEQTRWTIQDHVPLDVQHRLAREYATERMRVLASTSPYGLAERRSAGALLT
jgi:hypothetical protein